MVSHPDSTGSGWQHIYVGTPNSFEASANAIVVLEKARLFCKECRKGGGDGFLNHQPFYISLRKMVLHYLAPEQVYGTPFKMVVWTILVNSISWKGTILQGNVIISPSTFLGDLQTAALKKNVQFFVGDHGCFGSMKQWNNAWRATQNVSCTL